MQDSPLSRIIPRFLAVDESNTVHVRAVFPRDEEEFTSTKVEFERMSSCPNADVCQIFQDAHRNVYYTLLQDMLSFHGQVSVTKEIHNLDVKER